MTSDEKIQRLLDKMQMMQASPVGRVQIAQSWVAQGEAAGGRGSLEHTQAQMQLLQAEQALVKHTEDEARAAARAAAAAQRRADVQEQYAEKLRANSERSWAAEQAAGEKRLLAEQSEIEARNVRAQEYLDKNPTNGSSGQSGDLGYLGTNILNKGLEYAAQSISIASGRDEARFHAKSYGDIIRSDVSATQQQDSSAFGLGRVYRYALEHLGTAHPTLQNREEAAEGADWDDERNRQMSGLYGSREQFQFAQRGREAGLRGLLPSAQMRERNSAALAAAEADTKRKNDDAEMERSRALFVLNEQHKAGDISDTDYGTRSGRLDDQRDIAIKVNEEMLRQARDVATQGNKGADIAEGGENLARLGGIRTFQAASALRAGVGGSDRAFQLRQQQEMAVQRRTESIGGSTREETAGLEERQGQEREQRERDISLRIKGIRSEAQQDWLATQGRFYDQEKEKFEQSAREQMKAAHNSGQNEINALKADLDQQRQLMEQQHTWEMEAAKRSSDVRVSASRAGAETDTLRARGEFYNADEREFKASWDRKVQAAKDALANEHDVERQAMKRAELAAVQDEAGGALAARRGLQARDISIRGENVADTELRAQGKNYTAQLKEIRDHADREVSDARGNGPLQRRIREQEAADIKQEQFNIKQVGLNRPGEAVRHNFEQDLSGRLLGRNPFENLSDVMKSSDTTLKSIEGWLKQQAALAAP